MTIHWQTGDTEAGRAYNSYRNRGYNWFFATALLLILGVLANGVGRDYNGDFIPRVWIVYGVVVTVGLCMVGYINHRIKQRYRRFRASKRLISPSPLVTNFAAAVEALIRAEASTKYAWVSGKVRELMELQDGGDVAEVARIVNALMRELNAPQTQTDAVTTPKEQ